MSELQVRRTLQLGMLVLGFGWLACSQQSGDATPAVTEQAVPLSVYVVNYPLQYFAERIGGKHVNVSFPAPQGVDPAYWSPDAEVVVAYQEADVILLNGAGYARWVGRASLPYAKLVVAHRNTDLVRGDRIPSSARGRQAPQRSSSTPGHVGAEGCDGWTR